MILTCHLDCEIGRGLDVRSLGLGLDDRPCEERSHHGHVEEMGSDDREENGVQLEHAHVLGRNQSAKMQKVEFWPTVVG
jgi:hypothetical protein